MRRNALLAAAAIALGAPAPAARASPIKVATWNLNWLTPRPAGDGDLPADVTVTRTPADWARLAGYARKLDADVAALEEVDGPETASRLFPANRYTILASGDHVIQRVVLVVRPPVAVVAYADLTDLDVEPNARHRLRSGVDATLAVGGRRFRVLAVHLKSGCWTASEDAERRRACVLLGQQVPILAAWIAARRQEGIPFLVLGDFNRAFAAGDPRYGALQEAAGGALLDTEAGNSSPCWGGDEGGGDFIDHVLLGGGAADWLVPGSLRVMVYSETDPALKDHISDHCPVSVRLAVP